jgi:hypothetical protein
MQQVKGSWAKITAVTAMLCFLLGAGYALASQFLHQTGYYFEWNGLKESPDQKSLLIALLSRERSHLIQRNSLENPILFVDDTRGYHGL